MRRNLLRMLTFAGVLSVASLASADSWGTGNCFIQCSDGTTARLWNSPAECCDAFNNLCGGSGIAWMTYGPPQNPQIFDLDCPAPL